MALITDLPANLAAAALVATTGSLLRRHRRGLAVDDAPGSRLRHSGQRRRMWQELGVGTAEGREHLDTHSNDPPGHGRWTASLASWPDPRPPSHTHARSAAWSCSLRC
ncbi:hypothetical protein GCM10009664_64330 [Kitasatospora gansuensis]